MAGQQALHNFLNKPPSDPYGATGILTPPLGEKGSPRQQQAGKQVRQAQKDAAAKERQAQGAAAADQRLAAAKERQAQRDAAFQQRQAQGAAAADQRLAAAKERQDIAAQRGADRQAAQRGAEKPGQAAELKARVQGIGDRLESWADSVPTPGGIGVLLIAIFILLWAVVPVNGNRTRLQLFWLTLTGRTRMAATPQAGQSGSSGAGTGSGGMESVSNGHSVSAVSDLLAQLSIRDFGESVL